ncbi:DUF1016 N-terminal domain-containing protein [Pseudarthrobacter sulfonivorans]|uniref:DUF1016 N-terminal domain-containing protein n=1 Tax=Pseudarthrobacter sulfonivorans TaxID=121292 RepID=UPI000A4C1933|nr:DUF1016 N-terminal domain-containing protein [Pseudarthrobacter sulfonivorans]
MTDARDLALPAGYTDLLGELKNRVRAARTQALRTVNTQLVELYWSIGNSVRVQQEKQGWGSQVIKLLSEDLRAEFPDMKGLSARNIQYMTTFAGTWADGPIAQQPAAQLPSDCVLGSNTIPAPITSTPSGALIRNTIRQPKSPNTWIRTPPRSGPTAAAAPIVAPKIPHHHRARG